MILLFEEIDRSGSESNSNNIYQHVSAYFGWNAGMP